MSKITLQERLETAIAVDKKEHGYADYHRVMYLIWPPSEYPKAYRYRSEGGPPGVAMVFGKALNTAGYARDFESGRISKTK